VGYRWPKPTALTVSSRARHEPADSTRQSRRLRFYSAPGYLEKQPVLQRVGIDAYVIAMQDLAIQDFDG
jgi:hypothetical protein